MLAGPIYMLQVYDRVLGSRSVPTLVALSIGLVGAYALAGAARCRAGPHRRPAPRPCSTVNSGPMCIPRWLASHPEPGRARCQPAGPRSGPDARLPDRPGPDRHRRSALGAVVPGVLLSHPLLARRFGNLWRGVSCSSMTWLTERASRAPCRGSRQAGGASAAR